MDTNKEISSSKVSEKNSNYIDLCDDTNKNIIEILELDITTKNFKKTKRIIQEGIKKGLETNDEKYLEVLKKAFFNTLEKIKKETDKKAFIEKNKIEILNYFNNLINSGKTEYLRDLGEFFESIGYYYNAFEIYKEHIKLNKDYKFYGNIGDLLSKEKKSVYSDVFLNEEIIEAYTNLYESALLHRDIDNYIHGLYNLAKNYLNQGNKEKALYFYEILYNFASDNNYIELEEEILLIFYKEMFLKASIISKKISSIYMGKSSLSEDSNNNLNELLFELELCNEKMKKAIGNLLDIDIEKYILLEASFHEGKNDILAFKAYLDAYKLGVFDSGNALGMFIESFIKIEQNEKNKNILILFRDAVYNNEEIPREYIKSIKTIIKK